MLRRLTEDPERPYVVVLGGSKVSDKLGVIDNLLGKADRLLIGGGMVFTFLKAQGHEVGKSLLEEDQLDACAATSPRPRSPASRSCCPTDIVVAAEFAADATRRRRGRRRHPGGPARAWTSARESARAFADGARRRADGLLERPDGRVRARRRSPPAPGPSPQALTEDRRASVVGGGDSAAAVRTLGFDEAAFGHISTGGGASLEYLEGKTLPASTYWRTDRALMARHDAAPR